MADSLDEPVDDATDVGTEDGGTEPAGGDAGGGGDDLYERTRALLEPGDVQLDGVIVRTDLTSDEEPTLHQATLDVGDVVAEAAGNDPDDTYVYSGNDDERFGINQHQGRTLDDEFVWECQQLMRDGTYDVVFYYEADADQEAVVEGVEDLGFDATGVRGE